MSGLSVILRADASDTIGLGHVARCRALAQAVLEAGGRVRFLTRAPAWILPAEWPSELSVTTVPSEDEGEDAACTRHQVEEFEADAVVVDHYDLGPRWWRAVRSATALCAIDDAGRRDLSGECDLILNQNVGADPTWYGAGQRVLLGPRYVLLRPEFREARQRRPVSGTTVSPDRCEVLVTMGGSDPQNVTSVVVRALRDLELSMRVRVVVGPAFRYGDVVAKLAAEDPRMKVLVAPGNMAAVMADCDLVVSGGGSTLYELAYLGLPSLSVEMAPNQAPICQEMERLGTTLPLGRADCLSEEEIRDAGRALLTDPVLRRRISLAGTSLVDGLGAARVAACLGETRRRTMPVVTVRGVRRDDEERLLAWRNDPVTRAMSIRTEVVDPEDHARWFRRVMGSADCRLLVGECDAAPIGQVRFDFVGERWEISIVLAPEFRRRGLATSLLSEALDWFRREENPTSILALIRPGNRASVEVFRRGGFCRTGEDVRHGIPLEQWELRA